MNVLPPYNKFLFDVKVLDKPICGSKCDDAFILRHLTNAGDLLIVYK